MVSIFAPASLGTLAVRRTTLAIVASHSGSGARPAVSGQITGNWSKWWARYTADLGITNPRKVFHSFRHTFKRACRAARIEEELHDALTGHTSASVGRRY